MLGSKNFALMIVLMLAIIMIALSPAPAKAESAIADYAAIASIPEPGEKNIAVEGGAYYDRVNENGVFAGGLALAMGPLAFGVGAVHDNTGDNTTSYAIGTTFDLADYTGESSYKVKLKVGFAPDFDASGFDKVGTFGGKLRIEF